MTSRFPTIAYLTAGGAGMFCGSCMHDNTLAAALLRLGYDVQLIPLYTPIRTDEENVSLDQIFFGGINVYLKQLVPFYRHLPDRLTRWLDSPWLINHLPPIRTSARQLGALTVSMLQGEAGKQAHEVQRLVSWLADHLKPGLVNLSNLLIAGCIPSLQRRLHAPVLVTLQGDDLFLEDLTEPFKSQAMEEIRRLAARVDGFIVFSDYYAGFMSEYFQVPRERFHIVPLGLKLEDFPNQPEEVPPRPPTVGYFARICPAKGFHVLVEAFIRLRGMPGMEQVRLRAAGWLGAADRTFFRREMDKLRAAGLENAFEYAGVLERKEKLDFLRKLDVFCVPTTYRDPKGLFVLEALASRVPVVQPAHGAFPEMIRATGGGVLFRPHDTAHLAESLHRLLTDHDHREQLAQQGYERVKAEFGAMQMAERTLEVYRKFVKEKFE